MIVNKFENLDEINHAAAELFVQAARKAISENGRFTVALTGGSSPVQLYKILAQEPYLNQVSWEKVFVFWGDERWVPLDDPRSNARMAFETLLDHVPIPKEQVFPMWAEGKQPIQFASEYENQLKLTLGDNGAFDLILLGMGVDGHTASLFPGTSVLEEEKDWVKAYYLEPQQMHRITLTAPLINRAKEIVFLTHGENKAPALREILEGERNTNRYPAQLITPITGKVSWFVDKAAASKLSN
jgi:6-phosphogluconolactonase